MTHKRIVLGITGGIAAYKAAELARLLQKQGIDVQVAMTEAACHFITPTTMQALTAKPVLTTQWDDSANGMAHINASRVADAIVVAPATADFIAKLAHGNADDLLSTLCLARNCPLLIAPAMNKQMWENPATQRNIAQLVADGVTILGPDSGVQACGEEGAGRMLEAAQLAEAILAALPLPNGHGEIATPDNEVRHARFPLSISLPQAGERGEVSLREIHVNPPPKGEGTLSGVKLLLTAGPTYEAIDAVRGITNRSSGKMGYAIAQAARELGADVTLVSGPVALTAPQGVRLVKVESANEMFEAVKQAVATCDIFIGVAAVADYRVAQASAQKIKKDGGNLTLELVPNPDILAYVAALPMPPFCVGFAAESENLKAYAEQKRRAKKLPLLAANLAQQAIGADDNELILFDDAGEHLLPRADKLTQARALLQHVVKLRGA